MKFGTGITKLTMGALAASSFILAGGASISTAQTAKPNIVVIMGDDIGMWNIGAYHRGMMAGKTPNLDKLAREGMLFTDAFAAGASGYVAKRNRTDLVPAIREVLQGHTFMSPSLHLDFTGPHRFKFGGGG